MMIRIKEILYRLLEARIIPYDERPELRAAAKQGLTNKDVISDEEFYRAMAQLAMAKHAVQAFKLAWSNNEDSFTTNWMGQKLLGKIPQALRDAKDVNGRPLDFSNYFDIPNLGDGGFQFKLYKNGNLQAGQVKSRPDQSLNPNLTNATDAGYNKNFEDRLKYFFVKAGFSGKYQMEAGKYSIFQTPAIDGAIKVRVINHNEIMDFLSKDKGAQQYTADEKGKEIANAMDFPKKLEKIRKDAENEIGKPVAANQIWLAWKERLLKLTPEQQIELDIDKETQAFVKSYKAKYPNEKSPYTLPPDEMADFQQRQAKYAEKLAALRKRRGN